MTLRIVVTRKEIDAVRDAGGSVTFTEPGRAVVCGVPVYIAPDPPVDAVLVCPNVGVGTWQECDQCGASIVVHPSSPSVRVKICFPCAKQKGHLP